MRRRTPTRRPAPTGTSALLLAALALMVSACGPAGLSDGLTQPEPSGPDAIAPGDADPGDAPADADPGDAPADADPGEADADGTAGTEPADPADPAGPSGPVAGEPRLPAQPPEPDAGDGGDDRPVGAPAADGGDELAPDGPRGTWDGTTFTDEFGRTTTLSADEMAQYRRSNLHRRDNGHTVMLVPDFCLFDFARTYAETKPGGHHPLLTAIYPYNASGRASGSKWVQENYGMGSGTGRAGWTPEQWAVSRVDEGWMRSGSPTRVDADGRVLEEGRGHAENITNPRHRFYGNGIWVNEPRSTMISVQQFATHWANTPDCPSPPGDVHPNADLVAAVDGEGGFVDE